MNDRNLNKSKERNVQHCRECRGRDVVGDPELTSLQERRSRVKDTISQPNKERTFRFRVVPEISIAEVNRVFSLLFVSFSGAFRLYDVDNDGFITRDEMYNIVDAIYQMVVSTSPSNYFCERAFDVKRFVVRYSIFLSSNAPSYQCLSRDFYIFLKITLSPCHLR